MKTIEFQAIKFDGADEAIQHVDASGRGEAILWGEKYLVVERREAERLAATGVEFAYLVDHEMPDGTLRIVTIPVNG